MDSPEFKLFTCSYRYKGKLWTIDLPAQSFEDAEARLSAIHFVKIDGVIMAGIPVNPTTAPVTKFLVRTATYIGS